MTRKMTEISDETKNSVKKIDEVMDEKSIVALDEKKLQAKELGLDQGLKNLMLSKAEQTNVVNQHITFKDVSGVVLGGNVINIHMPSSTGITALKKAEPKQKFYVTPTIKKMSGSNAPLDDEAMDIIATHFDGTWKDFARKIKFSEGQIFQFEKDHSIHGEKEVTYQMLLDWQQRKTPTFGKTVTLLWKNGNYEIVKLLEEQYWNGKKEVDDDNETKL